MTMRFSAAIHLLLIASGFAGLGYQIVWTRMLSIGLGHEVYAVLAVVAAFFAGLALGALVLDRRIAAARRPGHWYAWLEIGIGLWALALIWLMPLANGWIADWIGPAPSPWRHWAVAFAGPLLLLLPATLAMGATLPAAEAAFAQARDGRGIGGLYGANALGAMAGALATAFLIAPAVGFSATLILFALVNLACAAGMLLLAPRGGGTGAEDAPSLSPSHAPKGLMPALFLSGLLGVGYEVAVVRALAQIVENTIY
ncbi:MAG: spermidine synthase, partial [Pseudomonadota bacterium]